MISLRARRTVSCLLLLVSIVIVCIGIANNYSLGDFGGPVPGFFILALSLLLLSINEGYQTALISSKALDISAFPRAQRVKTLIFSPDGSYDRLPRLFLGQSFMVVGCTYLVSSLTVFTEWPKTQGLDIFTTGGLAGILVCVNLAQLLPSIWGTKHPAEYLNSTPVIGPVVSGALFIESIGLFHFTFVFVRFLEMLSGQQAAHLDTGKGGFGSHPSKFSTTTFDDDDVTHTIEMNPVLLGSSELGDKSSSEGIGVSGDGNNASDSLSDRPGTPPGTEGNNESERESSIGYRVKIGFSTLLQCLCAYYLMTHLLRGHSVVGAPAWALLLVILMVYYVIFLAEGMKIALVGIAHLSKETVQAMGYDMSIYRLLANPEASLSSDEVVSLDRQDSEREYEVSRFLLGRQMIVVPLNFLLASIFTFTHADRKSSTMKVVTALSLPTVIFTVQIAQLAPQIFAARHPTAFLGLPGSALLVRAALAIQALGFTEVAHVLCDAIPPDSSWAQILVSAVNAVPLCEPCEASEAQEPRPLFTSDEGVVETQASRSFDGVLVNAEISDDDDDLGASLSDSHGHDEDEYRLVTYRLTETTSI